MSACPVDNKTTKQLANWRSRRSQVYAVVKQKTIQCQITDISARSESKITVLFDLKEYDDKIDNLSTLLFRFFVFSILVGHGTYLASHLADELQASNIIQGQMAQPRNYTWSLLPLNETWYRMTTVYNANFWSKLSWKKDKRNKYDERFETVIIHVLHIHHG